MDSNLNGCSALFDLYCSNNKLSYLNLNGCTLLKRLDCRNNRLQNIVLSGCNALQDLYCSCNQLSDNSLLSFYGLNLVNGKKMTFDLRSNLGFTQQAIQKLDENLPYITYEQILWDEYIDFSAELNWVEANMSGKPIGVCADDSSTLKINIKRTVGNGAVNSISVKILDKNDNINIPLGRIGTSTSNATSSEFYISYPTGNEWNLVYTAPDVFSNDSTNFEQEREVVVEIKINCSQTYNIPIKIIRPPVILIHGLRDNYHCFADLHWDLVQSGRYTNVQAFRVDYSATNDAAFLDNKNVVRDYIQLSKNIWQRKGFVVSKVDIVGHSMGGILSRLYLQSDNYKADIHKLITVNTPHSGSQSANIIVSMPILRYSFGYAGKANEDLQVNSTAIRNLLNGETLHKNIVPSHCIETNIFGFTESLKRDWKAGALYILYRLYYFYLPTPTPLDLLPQIAFNGNNDLVVASNSQIGGLTTYTTISDEWHNGSTSNPKVKSKIIELLELPSSSNEFVKDGFNPETINWFGIKKATLKLANIVNDSVCFVLPTIDTTAKNGEKINIQVAGTSGIRNLIFLAKATQDSVFLKDTTTSSLSFGYTIPASAMGKIAMYVFGADTLGNIFVDSTFVNVHTDAIPQSLFISYPTDSLVLLQGTKGSVHVSCLFSDGVKRDVSSFADVQYELLTGNASFISQGIIKGKKEGVDTLTVFYAGLSCKLLIVIEKNNYAHIITATVNPTNSGTITGAGLFNYNENINLTATPATGYTFGFWSINSSQISTNSTLTLAVDGDKDLVANFEIQRLTISIAANNNDGGTISGAGTFNYNQSVTITATTKTGYDFVNWTENGTEVSKDTSYIFNILANRNLVANFQISTGFKNIFNENSISIYPNPNNGKFTIGLDNNFNGEITVRIYSVIGNQLKIVKFNKSTNKITYNIDMENRSNGVYFVDLQTTKFKIVKKIIIH